jgi:hypothetical protein
MRSLWIKLGLELVSIAMYTSNPRWCGGSRDGHVTPVTGEAKQVAFLLSMLLLEHPHLLLKLMTVYLSKSLVLYTFLLDDVLIMLT